MAPLLPGWHTSAVAAISALVGVPAEDAAAEEEEGAEEEEVEEEEDDVEDEQAPQAAEPMHVG